MGMISEFKEFALKGNMVDMAVGIVMGGAVGGVVNSMVSNLINPIVGLFTGGQDFGALSYPIGSREVAKLDDAGKPVLDAAGEAIMLVEPLNLNYGAFITAFINFLILAFVIFMIVKSVNNAKKAMGMEKEAAPSGPSDNDLLVEIRDALVKK
ncbi:MAG: large conductance mechanosensitive channel protein MscL [Planctomycetaceae bacterium]